MSVFSPQGTELRRSDWRRFVLLCLLVAVVAPLGGCATYQHHLKEVREGLRENPQKASEKLEKKAKEPGKDQLVYLFDYATALQSAGNYEASTEAFLQANEMADYKDYVSLSRQASSLLMNQEQVPYKGEDYEKVLINAMLAINFLMEDDFDGALVEARRVNEKIEYFQGEQKKDYQKNVFAIYLGAMIWEATGEWTDAYIDYERAYELDPDIPYLQEDLVRLSKWSQRSQAHQKWREEFDMDWKKRWDRDQYGELILIVQQGWAPRKHPNPEARRLPILRPVPVMTSFAEVTVPELDRVERSQVLSSIEETSMKAFNDQIGALVAKRMAGVVAKEVAADQVRQQNEGLGALLKLFLHLSDRADLRQWSTLPESFQVVRLRLPTGDYERIEVQGVDDAGNPTSEKTQVKDVSIRAGETDFRLWRTYL